MTVKQLMLAALCAVAFAATAADYADTVVYGTIRTADTANPVAEAIAVKDGRFVYVGDEAGAAAFVNDGVTEIIDHRGQGMVMPGCTDGHSHYTMKFGMDNMKGGVMFALTNGKREVLQKLGEAALKAKAAGKHSLFGFGWNTITLAVKEQPTLAELDNATYGVSTVIFDQGGHHVFCNSECLKRCGIIDGKGGVLVKEIDGGFLELDESGYPTGYAEERVTGYLMRMGGIDYDEIIDDEVAEASVRATQELLLSAGYTIALEGWSNMLHPRKLYAAANRMDTNGTLKIVFPMTYEVEPWQTDMDTQIDYLASLNATYGTRHVRPEYLKVFMDGVTETKTGALLNPYKDGTVYKSFWSVDRLAAITGKCNARGLTVHTHVMGDAAIMEAADAYILGGDGEHRNCLVHLRNVRKDDFGRFAASNIACSAGMTWHVSGGEEEDKLLEELLRKEYIEHAYPIRSFFDAGVKVSSHSDFPANIPCPQDPFGIMQVAVTGLPPNPPAGLKPHDIDELITVEQAFQALTINGAWQMGLENERGSIAVGKWADFVLADQDVFTCAEGDIAGTKVVSTWFEGEQVFTAPPPGSEQNPWRIGTVGHKAEVTAWTNGIGGLIVEGSGAVASTPWTECADTITKLVKAEPVTGLETVMATLPALTSVNALALDELTAAAMAGAAKAGFAAIAVDNGKALLGVSVCTNGDVTAASESWGKAEIEDAVVVDGEAVLTIPATAEKGFMILGSKPAEQPKQ